MTAPKLVLVLSENWTLTPPHDMRALVRMAVGAEEAGFDAVMLSEHVVLGPGADADVLVDAARYVTGQQLRVDAGGFLKIKPWSGP